MKELAFISYRRQDSAAAARWLYRTFQQIFGTTAVFMDTESIRIASDWGKRIEQELHNATAVVAIVGPAWLKIADEYGQRRIDKADDWVRKEIYYALQTGKPVIPILLSKTPMPPKEALPAALAQLPERQGFELRDDRWEQDLSLLVSNLEALGFRRNSERPVRYPTPRITLAELSRDALTDALARLPGWSLTTSTVPGREPLLRTEFKKAFEFESFQDAIRFMAATAPYIASRQHHPRWENVWRTLTVWLTTWDIGHRPSALDIDLASYLDQRFAEQFQPKQTSAENRSS